MKTQPQPFVQLQKPGYTKVGLANLVPQGYLLASSKQIFCNALGIQLRGKYPLKIDPIKFE